MHCTCTAHALHMQCTCTARALHMHCTCTARALHMHCTCTAHELHMHVRVHGPHRLEVSGEGEYRVCGGLRLEAVLEAVVEVTAAIVPGTCGAAAWGCGLGLRPGAVAGAAAWGYGRGCGRGCSGHRGTEAQGHRVAACTASRTGPHPRVQRAGRRPPPKTATYGVPSYTLYCHYYAEEWPCTAVVLLSS